MTTSTSSTSSTKPSLEIVIGHDYSPLSDLALAEGVRLAARASRATLHVVHAVEARLTLAEVEAAEAEANRRIRPVVASALRASGGAGEVRLFTHVRQGHPGPEILALAADVEADVIVLGTHGRTGLQWLALGSVAEAVVRHARCPVHVMRAKQYAHPSAELVPDPPCPECVATRRRTGGATFWCVPHGETRRRPHVYSYQGAELHSERSDGLA